MRRTSSLSNRQLLQRESGTVYKEWGGRLPVALIFPNTYALGMSSLAVHTLYRQLNAPPDLVCERVFWDAATPRSMESDRELREFSLLAFSVSFELDYFNLIDMLRRAGLPLWAAARDAHQPLIIAGGPALTANPEPLAPFLDAIAIGEAEAILPPLLDLLRDAIHENRADLLAALARLPGLYVPAIHRPTDPPIARQIQCCLDDHPASTAILSPDTEFGDRFLIEIGRGCGRGCRFCLAGYTYRPVRELSLETILRQAKRGLEQRDRLGLVSAAVSDHSQIDAIVTELRRMGARISASAMRIDPVSEPLVRALAESDTRTLTLAPEAGSERLRRLINKTQSEDDVLRAASLAAHHGFHQLKLYFMIGLPGETEADIAAIIDLVGRVKARFGGRVTIDATPFVPKAHTPFQRAAMAAATTLQDRLRILSRALEPRGVAVRTDSPAWAAVQGVLARGDRRLAHALTHLTDQTTLAGWRRALRAEGLTAEEYLCLRAPDAPLPWQVVDSGISQSYLNREWQRAQSGPAPPAP
ncbi:MAG: radical SAM protein [Chloroflexota bacterium]